MPQPNYRLISQGSQLGIGVGGSQYVHVQAVAKSNSDISPYCVPNEVICGEIGRFLRLPIPPSGLVLSTARSPMVASLDFNLTGNTLPPVDVLRCVQDLPKLAAGVLIFDILIGNCDRHRQNFSVDFLSSPPQMNVFDHDRALLGYEPTKGMDRLSATRDRLGVSWGSVEPFGSGAMKHCLLEAVDTDTHFGEWIDRAASLPKFFVEEVCLDAVHVGLSELEAKAAADFLIYRKSELRSIIQNNREKFTAIDTWSLFP